MSAMPTPRPVRRREHTRGRHRRPPPEHLPFLTAAAEGGRKPVARSRALPEGPSPTVPEPAATAPPGPPPAGNGGQKHTRRGTARHTATWGDTVGPPTKSRETDSDRYGDGARRGRGADPFGTARLRRGVLDAWAASPARFREDANAEEDLALGGYRDRLVVELAQNAADAAARAGVPGRLRLTLHPSDGVAPAVLVASNTGAPLDATGVESLSTLRASAKRETERRGRCGRPVRCRVRRRAVRQRRAGAGGPHRRCPLVAGRGPRAGAGGGRAQPRPRRRAAPPGRPCAAAAAAAARRGRRARGLRHRGGAAAAGRRGAGSRRAAARRDRRGAAADAAGAVRRRGRDPGRRPGASPAPGRRPRRHRGQRAGRHPLAGGERRRSAGSRAARRPAGRGAAAAGVVGDLGGAGGRRGRPGTARVPRRWCTRRRRPTSRSGCPRC